MGQDRDTRQSIDEELRYRQHDIKLHNQAIVEFAYLTKEMIEQCLEDNRKLHHKRANCYFSCFYLCRRMLKSVTPEYLDQHERLLDFYREERNLEADIDYIRWERGDGVARFGEGGEVMNEDIEKFKLDLGNKLEKAKQRLEATPIPVDGKLVGCDLLQIGGEFHEVGDMLGRFYSQLREQNRRNTVEKIVAALEGTDLIHWDFNIGGTDYKWLRGEGIMHVQDSAGSNESADSDDKPR